jgi:hypothetical protein
MNAAIPPEKIPIAAFAKKPFGLLMMKISFDRN